MANLTVCAALSLFSRSLVVLLVGCGELEIGSYDRELGAGAIGGSVSGSGGTAGSGVLDQSCEGLTSKCNGGWPGCCAPALVDSDDFVLGPVDAPWSVPAHISLFYADAFEVTVSRFARFVDAFDDWRAEGHPRDGAGEHLHVPDSGWRSEWRLPASSAALEKAVMDCWGSTYPLRSTKPDLPMNCVDWYMASAFCIWDGKRLLTEAEWELAAKNGSEDRLYPWGNTEPSPEYAVYGCTDEGVCGVDDIPPVGSKPAGTSAHGLRDLAGSAAEWVFDAEGPYAAHASTVRIRPTPPSACSAAATGSRPPPRSRRRAVTSRTPVHSCPTGAFAAPAARSEGRRRRSRRLSHSAPPSGGKAPGKCRSSATYSRATLA